MAVVTAGVRVGCTTCSLTSELPPSERQTAAPFLQHMANPTVAPPNAPVPPARPREELVVRTRFVPPTLRRHIIARPRVEAIIARAMEYPLTVVKAEPGYGKTTAVASWLAASEHAQVWYNVGDTEADPHVFLLHLVQALRSIGSTIDAGRTHFGGQQPLLV